MDVILLSTVLTFSYLLILSKIFTLRFIVKHQIWFDVIFTFGIPILASKTYHGFAISVIAGLELSLVLFLLKHIVSPTKR